MISDRNPWGVFSDTANLSSKIATLDDAFTRLLDDTAEMTDCEEIAETTDLVRNLNELRQQLRQLLQHQLLLQERESVQQRLLQEQKQFIQQQGL